MTRTAPVAGRAAGPFLKWAGGKKQLLPQFERLYPKRVERYFEPFVGSGAVFFDVRRRFDLRYTALSDNNAELINGYQVVRDDVEGLIEALATHKAEHGESNSQHYYEVRELAPEALSPVKRAARLIYLNKTCYNGLYRVNAEGRFNVPVGRYQNPAIYDPKLLRAASEALQGVRLEAREFSGWLRSARADDFFYIDPPYYPRSKTANFTEYTGGGFGVAEQERLAQFARKLDAKGCLFMVSNSDTDVIKPLYEGFRITKVRARRAINSNHRARGRVNELVIRNY